MWNLVKIGQAVSEKDTILYKYIAQKQGLIASRGQNFDCN